MVSSSMVPFVRVRRKRRLNVQGYVIPFPLHLSSKGTIQVALEKIGFAAPNVQTPMIYDPSSAYSIPEQVPFPSRGIHSSLPLQIVQARVLSALEAASLSAMPPPSSYIAPLEMAAQPPDKYDPAQIQAMQREKDEEKGEERMMD